MVAEVSNTCRIYHGSALSYYLLAVIRDNANTKAICLLTIKNSNLRNKAMQYKRATDSNFYISSTQKIIKLANFFIFRDILGHQLFLDFGAKIHFCSV